MEKDQATEEFTWLLQAVGRRIAAVEADSHVDGDVFTLQEEQLPGEWPS
jgi:hypothetical protein